MWYFCVDIYSAGRGEEEKGRERESFAGEEVRPAR